MRCTCWFGHLALWALVAALALWTAAPSALAKDRHHGGGHGHKGHVGAHYGGKHSGISVSFGYGGRGYYSRGYYSRGYYPHRYYRYGYTPSYYRYRSYGYGYSPYRYRYGYSPYYDGYYRPTNTYASVIYGRGYEPVPERVTYVVEDSPTYETVAAEEPARVVSESLSIKAWTLLSEGRTDAAWRYFTVEAQNNPDKGGPKVGYALAAALSGDLSRGIWAMRRAVSIDPQAMHYVVIDDALHPEVVALSKRYERKRKTADTQFMVATLQYLLRDPDAAERALDRAADKGDDNQSAANLRELVTELRQELQAVQPDE